LLEKLTHEDFAPLVGTSFEVKLPDGSAVALSLAEVKVLGPKPARLVKPGTRTQAFSLRFTGPERPLLPQRTWEVAHPALGSHPIFLVPIGREEGALQYEAVFN
jgi:hypothetical protein